MSWLSHVVGNDAISISKLKWNKWALKKNKKKNRTKVLCPVYGNVHSLFSNHDNLTQQQCDAVKADMRTLWDDETGFNPGWCSALWQDNLTSWLLGRRGGKIKQESAWPCWPPLINPTGGSGHLHHQESCKLHNWWSNVSLDNISLLWLLWLLIIIILISGISTF